MRLHVVFAFCLAVLAAIASPAAGAGEAAPKPADPLAAARTENEELRRELLRQKEQIAKLEEQVRRLEAMLARAPAGAERPGVIPDAPPPPPPPAANAAQQRAGSKRVIYVVDASGSMIDRFPKVREELRKGMANLRPETTFNLL